MRECPTDTMKTGHRGRQVATTRASSRPATTSRRSSTPSRSRPASSAPRPSRARAARPAWSPTARPRWSCRATGNCRRMIGLLTDGQAARRRKIGWFPFPSVDRRQRRPRPRRSAAATVLLLDQGRAPRAPTSCKYLDQRPGPAEVVAGERHQPAGEPGGDLGDHGPDAADGARRTLQGVRTSSCTSTGLPDQRRAGAQRRGRRLLRRPGHAAEHRQTRQQGGREHSESGHDEDDRRHRRSGGRDARAGRARRGAARRPGRGGASGWNSRCCSARRWCCSSGSCCCRSRSPSTTASTNGTGSGRSTTPSGCGNYQRVLDDAVFLHAMLHNLIIAVLSLVIQLPLSIGLALLLNRKIRGRAVLRLVVFAPYVLSEAITAVVWLLMLQPGGFVDQLLQRGRARQPIQQWLADRRPGALHALRGHHLEVHRLRHHPAARRPAGHPGRAAGGRRHRRRVPWQTTRHIVLPLLGPDHPDLDLPVRHRFAAAVRPGVDHDARRPGERVDHDGDIPARPRFQPLRVRLRQRRRRDPLHHLLRLRPALPALRAAPRHRRAH